MINPSPERFLLFKQIPHAKAIITSEKFFTYDELRNKVLVIASMLNENNISPGSRIGIISKNNIDFVFIVLALWQLSAVPVPINIRLTQSEIEEQLSSADCNVVLVDDESKEKLINTLRKKIIITFKDSFDKTFISRNEIKLNDPAVIIFTSGSSGMVKGVVLTFGSLFNSAINSNHVLRYNNSDRCLASLPFYHIAGFSLITRSLLFGLPLLIPDSLSNEDIAKSILQLQPTIISLVAAQLKYFVDNKLPPNPELKRSLLGGGFSDTELIKDAIELGWPIVKVYGSTETASFVSALLTDEFIFKPNSAGRVVPTNKILIFDTNGIELKPFEVGEIVVQSNSIMISYLEKEQTEQKLKDGFYYSGDLGYIDDEGYLFIEGRKNNLISTGGENVNTSEIENVLLTHPMIAEAAVFPIKDEKWGEIVCASVVMKDKSGKVTIDEIKKFLKKKIAGFKIPKKIFFEYELPKTELGKIEKNKLINRYRLTSL
jgi:O-succinylbenzoic acid--CoA ligase